MTVQVHWHTSACRPGGHLGGRAVARRPISPVTLILDNAIVNKCVYQTHHWRPCSNAQVPPVVVMTTVSMSHTLAPVLTPASHGGGVSGRARRSIVPSC